MKYRLISLLWQNIDIFEKLSLIEKSVSEKLKVRMLQCRDCNDSMAQFSLKSSGVFVKPGPNCGTAVNFLMNRSYEKSLVSYTIPSSVRPVIVNQRSGTICFWPTALWSHWENDRNERDHPISTSCWSANQRKFESETPLHNPLYYFAGAIYSRIINPVTFFLFCYSDTRCICVSCNFSLKSFWCVNSRIMFTSNGRKSILSCLHYPAN